MKNIPASFGIPNLSQLPDISRISDRGISDFQISGQSIIKGNCDNSRRSDDIDMKLGPINKFVKRNKTTSKKFGDDVKSENCDFIVIFTICGQFGAILKPDSQRTVRKTYVFINSERFFYKNCKQNQKISNTIFALLP